MTYRYTIKGPKLIIAHKVINDVSENLLLHPWKQLRLTGPYLQERPHFLFKIPTTIPLSALHSESQQVYNLLYGSNHDVTIFVKRISQL